MLIVDNGFLRELYNHEGCRKKEEVLVGMQQHCGERISESKSRKV